MTNGCPAGGLDSSRCCRDCDISGHGDIGSLHYRDNDIPGYGYCDRLCRWSVEVAIGRLFQQTEVREVQYYSHHQQRPEHHIGRTVLICDMIIISSSHFVLKDREKVVYGFVTLYICSFAIDQGNE